jgi:hypothetical protein
MEVMTGCAPLPARTCRLWIRSDLTSWTRVNIFWLVAPEKVSSGSTSRLSLLKLLLEPGLKESGQVNYVHV